jgi:uncharacterized membrane protein
LKVTLRARRLSLATSLVSLYAAAYVVLTIVVGPLSYGQLNLRVANVMLGLVPIIGWPAIIGQTLGVLITASVSPLGPVDLVNVVPALCFSWLIWKLKRASVLFGLTLYSVGLGLSVSLTLQFVTGIGLAVLIPYVTAGIFAMTAGGGYLFYRAVMKSNLCWEFIDQS